MAGWVEYHVRVKNDHSVESRVFHKWEGAAGYALGLASTGKLNVILDVVVYGEEGAMEYAGQDGVERYRDDPDASVFERFEITRVNNLGMIP